jgi:AraC-like DNA-binding protein
MLMKNTYHPIIISLESLIECATRNALSHLERYLMHHIRVPSMEASRLESLGVSVLAVLEQAHLPLTLLQEKRPVLSTRQWFAVWHAFAEISNDTALGLKIGSDIPVERYDPIFIAAMCARTFREALSNVARFKHQFCAEEIHIIEYNSMWHINVTWNDLQEPIPALLIDGMFATYMTLGHRGSGQPLYPERVLFAGKARHRTLYEDYFHCVVEFGADTNQMIYHPQKMETPFRTFNSEMQALLIPHLEGQLRDYLAQKMLSEQVKAVLLMRLPNKQITIQDVASELHMSPRTLQRQLAEEGTRFQHILTATRHELARRYLRISSLDLNEIAYLLGYEEASSFHRAFHDWENLSPGQWRLAHKKQQK